MTIVPTLGRVIWYTPLKGDNLPVDGDGRCAALVAKVGPANLINIGGFDATGQPFARLGVPLVQEGEAVPVAGGYATWMPFQIAQAVKHATESPTLRPSHPPASGS